MKLIGCMLVRNEDWILGLTLRAALMWCDEMVVLLHACTDNSVNIALEVLDEFPGRLNILGVRDPKWDEMGHRQQMLECARTRGATHIAIVDADEILTGNLLSINMFGQGALMDPHCGIPLGHILQLPMYNLRGGIDRYHSNGVWGNRIVSVAFADAPCLEWSGDRFHHREPDCKSTRPELRLAGPLSPYQPIQQGQGGVMHGWGASERRLIAKHWAYRITERLRWPDKPVQAIEEMYSLATVPREPWTYADVPGSWWAPYVHLMKHLDLEQVPWQEEWCAEMVKQHGAETFRGLTVGP